MMPPGPPWGVVHCVFSVGVGGQEVVILSLAANANRELFAPRVLCFEGAGELAPRFEARGVHVDVLARPAGTRQLGTLIALRRYLRARRPAILHTHNPTPHQYGAIARLAAGVPVLVHTKHGRNEALSPKSRRYERLAGRLTDAVVPVSIDAANVAQSLEGVPAHRIRVIHNGVDVADIAPRLSAQPGWRVVHVARLNIVKDQATLLRAARLVLDREPRFRLDLVGDGEMRPELERLAAELCLGDAVRFHGFHDDVRPFLAAADLFVLSSLSEGIAITLLEAMAAGLPVVATDVGGNSEVVVHDETGLLVPVGNPAALADGLLRMLGDPAAAGRMGRAGRERVATNFALKTTIDEYESLYLELLHRRFGRDRVL